MRKGPFVLLSALVFIGSLAAPVNAAPISFVIGDDDGFGGTNCSGNCDPGQVFSNLSTPSLVPSAIPYADTAGMDATTVDPWMPYSFTFSFSYDASQFLSLSSAVVEIQTGSLARRTSGGTGYGLASVTGVGTSTLGLGDFLTTSTGATASAEEESVKMSSFNVLSIVSAGAGSLTITVDGSLLSNPVDQFAIDFARLTIDGTESTAASPVPEPSTIALLGAGLISAAVVRYRRRK